MGWSEYLAAAGCVSTAVTYQLYQAKTTDYKSLSIDLYKKIHDLEQRLEHECQKGNSTIVEDKKKANIEPVFDVVKVDADKIGCLQKEAKNLEERNQVLESDATSLKKKNVELELNLQCSDAKVNQLQLELENTALEKESLRELYQFRLNSEIERLITARDLEIANLSHTVKSFEGEKKKVQTLSEQLLDADRRLHEKENEISTLKNSESTNTQSVAQLNKKLDELHSSTRRYEVELKQMVDQAKTDAKEISRLKNELDNSNERLSNLSPEIETLTSQVSEKEEAIVVKDNEINNLHHELEEQRRLFQTKDDLLNNALEVQDDFRSKFKELGYEIGNLLHDVTEIEKMTKGNLRSLSTSEEFDIVNYNESKPSSEEFEELNMEDAEHSSDESTGKVHDQDKSVDHPASSGNSSVDSEESIASKTGYITDIQKQIQMVREHVRNVKTTIMLGASTTQEKKSLLQKFNDILNKANETGLTIAPDLAQKLEDNTKKIEQLDAKIEHLRENNTLCGELGSLQETRDMLDVQVLEARLENGLIQKIQNCLNQGGEIKDLKAELTQVSSKVQDYHRLKADRADLENKLAEKESEIERLTKELNSLVDTTEKIDTLRAELSDKDKEIHTLNNMLKVRQANREASDSAQKEAGSTDDFAIPVLQASSSLSLKSPNEGPIGGPVESIPTNAAYEGQSIGIASTQRHKRPESDTTVSNLSPHPSKPILEGKQGNTNKESENPENLTTCPVSEESEFRTAEKSYKLTIADLKSQLLDANLKIAKQHKVISKNLELLKESRSQTSSPIPSPTKN